MNRYIQIDNSQGLRTVLQVVDADTLPAGIGWVLCDTAVSANINDPCEWLIDLGPFADRLQPYTALIDMSTDPRVIAINKDVSRRKYVNLKDPRVEKSLRFLAGEVDPDMGTLETPLITAEIKEYALTHPVDIEENRSLRAVYFKGLGI